MSKINNTIDKLRKEYRPTMDVEVLHSWAKDVVAALDVRPHTYDCDDPLKEDTSLNFEVGETPEEELKRLMQSRIAEGVVLRVSNPSSDDNWPSNMFKNAARYGKNGGEVK